MEKAYDAFQFYFNMNSLRPSFLTKRLIVLLFKSHDDYLTYVRETGGLEWAAGFYSQRSNRITFYDELNGPAAAQVNDEIAKLRSQLEDLNRQIAAASRGGPGNAVNRLTQQRNYTSQAIGQLTARLNNAAQTINNAVTMHEAAHQISYNTGIQTRLVDYPLWLTEGLACSFETEDSQGHRGPAQLDFGRIAQLKQVIKDNHLIPIEQFITDPPSVSDDESRTILYSESWALFHFLYRFHRPELEKYLLDYKARPPLRVINSEQRKEIFVKAFGLDFDALNTKFVAYINSLPARAN